MADVKHEQAYFMDEGPMFLTLCGKRVPAEEISLEYDCPTCVVEAHKPDPDNPNAGMALEDYFRFGQGS